MKKIIGLTLDMSLGGDYSASPWYALRSNYCDMVMRAGGVPIGLPYYEDQVDSYLDQINGLIVTGGKADVDPSFYGETSCHPSVFVIPERTKFEMKMVRGALERGMPILGICGGHQVLNVVLGGTLIQHIPEFCPDAIKHHDIKELPNHPLRIIPGTRLHDLLQVESMIVNTHHHQAVKTVGQGVIVNAQTEDGIIEGIELQGYSFCMGVQWHPEYDQTVYHQKIMESFISSLT